MAKKKTSGGSEPGKLDPQHEGPMICQACGGNGKVATENLIILDGKPTTKVERVDCPSCGGTGEIR